MDTLVVPTPRRLVRALIAAALVLGVVAVLSDLPGRLLAAPAAVAALVLALRDLRAGPVLVADPEGVTVRTGWRHEHAAWAEVERMRVVRDRRAELLELDLGRTVVLVSRTRLDRLPGDVLTDLLAVRAASATTQPPPP